MIPAHHAHGMGMPMIPNVVYSTGLMAAWQTVPNTLANDQHVGAHHRRINLAFSLTCSYCACSIVSQHRVSAILLQQQFLAIISCRHSLVPATLLRSIIIFKSPSASSSQRNGWDLLCTAGFCEVARDNSRCHHSPSPSLCSLPRPSLIA